MQHIILTTYDTLSGTIHQVSKIRPQTLSDRFGVSTLKSNDKLILNTRPASSPSRAVHPLGIGEFGVAVAWLVPHAGHATRWGRCYCRVGFTGAGEGKVCKVIEIRPKIVLLDLLKYSNIHRKTCAETSNFSLKFIQNHVLRLS